MNIPNSTIRKTFRWCSLLCASATLPMAAQELVEGFEDHTLFGVGQESSSDPALILETVATDPLEGVGALGLSYDFIADGASLGFVEVRGPGAGYDLSGYTGLSLSYKTITPADPPTNITFVFKLVDVSTEGTDNPQVEFWQFRSAEVLVDATGEWQELLIPFEDLEIPSWEPQGDEVLDLDMIENWQFQVLVEGNGVGSTYTGEIHFDNLTLYEPTDGEDEEDETVTNLGPAGAVEVWEGEPLIVGNANPSLSTEEGAGAGQGVNEPVSEVIAQSFQPERSFTLEGISIVGQASEGEGTYSLDIYDLGAGEPLNAGDYTAEEPIATVGFITDTADEAPAIYHFDFTGLEEELALEAGNNYVIEVTQVSGEEFFWARMNDENSAYENGTLFKGRMLLEGFQRDAGFAIYGTAEPLDPDERLEMAIVFFGAEDAANSGGYIDSADMGWIWGEAYPWVYNYSLEGWLYAHGPSLAEGSWFYDDEMAAWWFTITEVYPWVYVDQDGWTELEATTGIEAGLELEAGI